MAQVCILTDSTAQFPNPAFPGSDRVHVIPIQVKYKNHLHSNTNVFNLRHLPTSSIDGAKPKLHIPSLKVLRKTFLQLGQNYNEIIAILTSKHLGPVVAMAQEAAEAVSGKTFVWVIDSQTTTVGLGLLVQHAAEAVKNGAPSAEIVRQIRSMIPRIYTLFFTQNLNYLQHSGFIEPEQAMIGEMMRIAPLLLLEKGRPVPIQKARSARNILDMLHEFINEFDTLSEIALIQGLPPLKLDYRALCDRISKDFPALPVTRYRLDLSLATILGPCSLGIVAIEANR
jgi:DegV family protein with EDD domain